MFKRIIVLAFAAITLGAFAHADWVPTGRTKFNPLPTLKASPGQTITLKARLQYELKNTQKPRGKRWDPLPNAKVEFSANPQRWEYIGTAITGGNGWATMRYQVPTSVKPGKRFPYRAEFLGRKYQGVWLHKDVANGLIQVK